MKKAKTKGLESAEIISETSFKWIFLPLLLLIVISHLFSVYWWTPFLWGIHGLYFFPRWVGWTLTIIALSVFIPLVNDFILKLAQSIFSVLEQFFFKIKKKQLFAIISLVSIPLFWLLRTKYYLWGDGYFKIDDLYRGAIIPTEPLDGIIHVGFYRLLTTLSPSINPSFSYSILSVACGGIYVFLILSLSDRLGKTTFQRILIFSALMTLGSLELFFGYAESYTILSMSLTLFVLSSILYIQHKISIIFSFLTLVLSISLHVSAIVFVPTLLYLVFWKWHSEKRKLPEFTAILSLVGCSIIVFLAVWKVFLMKGPGNRFGQFVPILTSDKTDFTMFCKAHLMEFINQVLLLSPVGMFLFLFFLYFTLKLKSFKDPLLNFLLLSSLLGLFLIFIYNSRLGSADWDLRAFPGVFFTLCGILLFIKWGSQWSKFKYYGLILMAVSFFHTAPWILLNADRQMSVDRYVLTSTSDPHLLTGGMWRIARVLEIAGLRQVGDELLKEGIRKNPWELPCYSILAKSLNLQGKHDEAIFYLESALKLKPDSKDTRFLLGQTYMKKNDLGKAIFHLEKIKGEYEKDSLFVINLATAYMKADRLEEAKNLMQEFLNRNSEMGSRGQESATMRRLLGGIFFVQRDYPNAKREWEIALKLNPDEALAKKGMEELRKIGEK